MSGEPDAGPPSPGGAAGAHDLTELAPHDAVAADAGTIDAGPGDAGPTLRPGDANLTPRPGVFGLEGRAVPGLYVVGWVGSLLGAGTLVISLLATVSAAAPWLFLVGLVLLAGGLASAAGSQAVERGRRPELAYRGPSPVLAFVLVVVLTLVALVAVLAPLAALGLDARSPAATTVNLLITAALYVAVIRLLVVGPGALTWTEMGVVRPSVARLRDLLLGAALAVPVLVATLLLGAFLARFLQPTPNPLPEAVDTGGLALNLLSAAVLAPIGEELFFRGFTTTAWERTSGPRAAVVRGAVFFACAHVVTLFDATFTAGAQHALYSFVVLLPVGLTLGWLFLGRRSLYAAVGLHGAFNGIQLLLLALATSAR